MVSVFLALIGCAPTIPGGERPAAPADGVDTGGCGADRLVDDLILGEPADVAAVCADACPVLVQDNLIISGDTIPSLDGLWCVEEVGGYLSVSDTSAVTDLTGLGNVVRVGDLRLQRNAALVSTGGLDALGRVDRGALIEDNTALVEVSLPALVQVGGALQIADNALLERIQGDATLGSVEGDLRFYSPAGLVDLSLLTGLRRVGGTLDVMAPATPEALGALAAVEEVGLDLVLEGHAGLADLAPLAGLRRVGGTLRVTGNPDLVRLDGLDALAEPSSIWLRDNPALASLSGLAGLTSVPGSLTIEGSGALRDLSGLEAMREVGEVLDIRENDVLVDLSALFELRRVGGTLQIVDNPTLRMRDAYALVEAVEEIGGDVVVAGNGPQ
jgi:hypothetical protein